MQTAKRHPSEQNLTATYCKCTKSVSSEKRRKNGRRFTRCWTCHVAEWIIVISFRCHCHRHPCYPTKYDGILAFRYCNNCISFGKRLRTGCAQTWRKKKTTSRKLRKKEKKNWIPFILIVCRKSNAMIFCSFIALFSGWYGKENE